MRMLYPCLVLFLSLIACNNKDQNSSTSLLNPSNLISESFTIDITKDTVLLSKKGAVIKVPKGTLTGSSTNLITLELKEAYSMEDMLKAGLVTTSNGKPLSSGGMFYINVKEENVRISNALSIAIPTPYINPDMSLFKGEETQGKINWTSPATLPPNPQLTAIQKGQELFKQCAPCHGIGKELTGPDLAHIVKRSPTKEIGEPNDYSRRHIPLYEFTNNWLSMANHPYYLCVINSRPTVMNIYEFSYEDLDNLYGYIENESELKNLPIGDTSLPACMDSCARYLYEKMQLKEKRNRLVDDSKNKIEEIRKFKINPDSVDDTPPVARNIPDIDKVQPLNSDYTYYHLKVETFGWYNIDILMDDLKGNQNSLLTVRILGSTSSSFDLYLAVPSQRVLGQGGLLETKEVLYGFYSKDGNIKLPQDQEAYIIAMGEEGDQLVYGVQAFTITAENRITVSLSKITKEEFNNKMKSLSLDNLSITAGDSKHADEIRQLDKKMPVLDSLLKPKGCNCDCLLKDSVAAENIVGLY